MPKAWSLRITSTGGQNHSLSLRPREASDDETELGIVPFERRVDIPVSLKGQGPLPWLSSISLIPQVMASLSAMAGSPADYRRLDEDRVAKPGPPGMRCIFFQSAITFPECLAAESDLSDCTSDGLDTRAGTTAYSATYGSRTCPLLATARATIVWSYRSLMGCMVNTCTWGKACGVVVAVACSLLQRCRPPLRLVNAPDSARQALYARQLPMPAVCRDLVV
ncbi:hypothetical protein BCV69DRAFT_59532 [Microstroma glucosiphilum]|uniref:Uncharacterized protein n=1 Tax=Pseudomicrostroma glucosiphilum TaxID=1684307 RepID=A0A316U7X6_9BASI|nr:hypothetical protein BCV69DRAFT_59532 [Pseudomicrostroma glucosiphilum]PWN19065.1 hypothetical protein BCV69DRAFT_59532 [Pseudomicrostroma glucosiphilum]